MATVYVQPEVGVRVMDDLAAKKVGEVWLNPGADGPEVVARAGQAGAQDDSGLQHHRHRREPAQFLVECSQPDE